MARTKKYLFFIYSGRYLFWTFYETINFATVFPIYNSLGPPGIKYLHAHNDYLQLLAEAGWPGFIALVGGFFAFLGRGVWKVREIGAKLDPARFYVGIGAISGLVSIAFHSFFDFNLQIPSNILYFVVLLAICNFCLEGVDGRSFFWRKPMRKEYDFAKMKGRKNPYANKPVLSGSGFRPTPLRLSAAKICSGRPGNSLRSDSPGHYSSAASKRH